MLKEVPLNIKAINEAILPPLLENCFLNIFGKVNTVSVKANSL